MVCALSDLLVRRESDANLAVLNLGMLQQVLARTHDLCNSGFVVRTEQGLTVGHDDILSLITQNLWILGRLENDVLCLVEHDIVSVVVVYYPRLNMFARSVRRSVHMRNETDYRLAFHTRRDSGHDIAILVQVHFLHADGLQFLAQILSELNLSRR